MNTQAYSETNVVPSNIPSVVTTVFPAVGRLMISTLFILAGLSKIAAPAMTIGYIQSVGLPLPSVAFGLAAFTEIVGGTLLLLGYRTRIVAGVLFVFTLATVGHPRMPGRRIRRTAGYARAHSAAPDTTRGSAGRVPARCRGFRATDRWRGHRRTGSREPWLYLSHSARAPMSPPAARCPQIFRTGFRPATLPYTLRYPRTSKGHFGRQRRRGISTHRCSR